MITNIKQKNPTTTATIPSIPTETTTDVKQEEVKELIQLDSLIILNNIIDTITEADLNNPDTLSQDIKNLLPDIPDSTINTVSHIIDNEVKKKETNTSIDADLDALSDVINAGNIDTTKLDNLDKTIAKSIEENWSTQVLPKTKNIDPSLLQTLNKVPKLNPILKPKGFQRGTVNKCYLHSFLHMLLNNKRFCYKVLQTEDTSNPNLNSFKSLINKYWNPSEEISSDDYAFITEKHNTLKQGNQEDVYFLFQILTYDFGLERSIFEPIFYFNKTEHLITLFKTKSHTNANIVEHALCLDIPLDNNNVIQPNTTEANIFQRMVEYYFRYSLRGLIDNYILNQMTYFDKNIQFNKSLIIRIGRNKYENPTEKYTDNILFPTIFINYELKGFIVHSGVGSKSGHYVYYGKNEIDQKWYYYNDSRAEVEPNFEQYLKQAYLLYYEQFQVSTKYLDNPLVLSKHIENVSDQTDYPSKIFDFYGSIGCLEDGTKIIQTGKDGNDAFKDETNNDVLSVDKTKLKQCIEYVETNPGTINQDQILINLSSPDFTQILQDNYNEYHKKEQERSAKIKLTYQTNNPINKPTITDKTMFNSSDYIKKNAIDKKNSEDIVFLLLSDNNTLTLIEINEILKKYAKQEIDKPKYDEIIQILNLGNIFLNQTKTNISNISKKSENQGIDIELLTSLILDSSLTFKQSKEYIPTLTNKIYDDVYYSLYGTKNSSSGGSSKTKSKTNTKSKSKSKSNKYKSIKRNRLYKKNKSLRK